MLIPAALRLVAAPVSESRSVPISVLPPKFQRSFVTRLIPVVRVKPADAPFW